MASDEDLLEFRSTFMTHEQWLSELDKRRSSITQSHRQRFLKLVGTEEERRASFLELGEIGMAVWEQRRKRNIEFLALCGEMLLAVRDRLRCDELRVDVEENPLALVIQTCESLTHRLTFMPVGSYIAAVSYYNSGNVEFFEMLSDPHPPTSTEGSIDVAYDLEIPNASLFRRAIWLVTRRKSKLRRELAAMPKADSLYFARREVDKFLKFLAV